jgi:hypothetical protein
MRWPRGASRIMSFDVSLSFVRPIAIDNDESCSCLADRDLKRSGIGELHGALGLAGPEHREMMDARHVRAEGIQPRPNRVGQAILRAE